MRALLTLSVLLWLSAGTGCGTPPPEPLVVDVAGATLHVDVEPQLPGLEPIDLRYLPRLADNHGRWYGSTVDRPWRITSASFALQVAFLDAEHKLLKLVELPAEPEAVELDARELARIKRARHALIAHGGWFSKAGLSEGAPLRQTEAVMRRAPQLPEATLTVGGQTITVELAYEPRSRQQGLMWREGLPDDRGMLFAYRNSSEMGFWMKNCVMPIAIAYIRADGTIANTAEMAVAPKGGPFPSYPSDGPVRFALEMRSGWYADKGVEAGAKVTFSPELEALIRERVK